MKNLETDEKVKCFAFFEDFELHGTGVSKSSSNIYTKPMMTVIISIPGSR